MELRIDFYSKDEAAIRMDFDAPPPVAAVADAELLVFASFIMRTFSNFNGHPVGVLLEVLMAYFDEETARRMAAGEYRFPEQPELLMMTSALDAVIGIDFPLLYDKILTPLPRQADWQGEGKKSFAFRGPPFLLNLKGFGLLGLDLNYYAFHAALALYRWLASKRVDDDQYLRRLSTLAGMCSRYALMNRIGFGQSDLIAAEIFKEVAARM